MPWRRGTADDSEPAAGATLRSRSHSLLMRASAKTSLVSDKKWIRCAHDVRRLPSPFPRLARQTRSYGWMQERHANVSSRHHGPSDRSIDVAATKTLAPVARKLLDDCDAFVKNQPQWCRTTASSASTSTGLLITKATPSGSVVSSSADCTPTGIIE